jgi:hypothetical protein
LSVLRLFGDAAALRGIGRLHPQAKKAGTIAKIIPA